MPLLPFQLFKAETRLIVHKKCLYKLKLTYNPDISSSAKALWNEKDEINAELTRVIRAVFFLIGAKKNIPQKIITQFFTVSVTVKFWKIAQKLGFSKNGSRLKCGHLIELALDRNESRIQEANAASTLVKNNFKNENVENLGHLGLRQFVINSDESDSQSYSSSDDVTMDNSLEHSRSVSNEDNGGFPANRYVQEEYLDKGVRHHNYLDNQTNQTPLTADVSVQTPWPSDIIVPISLSADPIAQTRLNSDAIVQNLLTSDSAAQTPLNSEPIIQTVSLSVQDLNKHEHLSEPLSEPPVSLQALPIFMSSCTQTDFEELDATADIPELNSRDQAGSHVSSDHAYPKSLPPMSIEAKKSISEVGVSNLSKDSAEFKGGQMSDEGLSVASIKSSNLENRDNKNDDVSVKGDCRSVKGDGNADGPVVKDSDLREVNNLIEPTKDAHTVGISDREAENNLCSTHNSDSNDVWGIDVASKVETSEQSQSDNNQETMFSPQTKKLSMDHHSSQLVTQDGISSNTKKSETSPKKSQSNPSKKWSNSKDNKPDSASVNVPRLKSLRSYKKVETVLDQKPRSVRKTRNSSSRQTSVSQRKKTPSNDNRRKQRQKQGNQMQQEVLTDISFGLHDRYQVQTQELQEDLKLQDLAHPSSSDTKRKRRSLFDYINFSYFLRTKKSK